MSLPKKIKCVLYLYNGYEFNRSKDGYGYWNGKTYSIEGDYYYWKGKFVSDKIQFPDCQQSITTNTMRFNSIMKANNKGYDCLKLKFVTGFDIESEDGEILEEQHFNKFEKEFWCLYQELNFFEKRKYLKQLKQMKGDI